MMFYYMLKVQNDVLLNIDKLMIYYAAKMIIIIIFIM